MSENDTKVDFDVEEVSTMAQELYEIVDGENIINSFRAIEMVIMILITNNCISKSAGDEVIETMTKNLTDILKMHDEHGLCVWNEEGTLN